MRKPIFAVILVAASLSLAGCQGLFHSSHNLRSDARVALNRNPTAYAAIQLAVGKKALGNGQYAEAISAFRVARSEPEYAADSYNGLAIAYANLGRTDLADRYFNQAIALAPSDDRFRANLARLYRTQIVPIDGQSVQSALAMAQQEAAQIAPMPAVAANVASPGLRGAVTVARPETRLVRVSANEVRLGTAAPVVSHVSVAARGTRGAVAVEPRIKAGAGAYPVRISVLSTSRVVAGGYPVRVAINSTGQTLNK